MQNNDGIQITPLEVKHCFAIAKLHIQGIPTGFISSLGIDFVTALYEAIAQSETSFGFVAEENEGVFAFVALTTNLNKLYKSVIIKKGLRFALLLAGKMFSPKQIKKVFETLFYPGRIKNMNLPRAELLSIVIAERERGKGLASALVKKSFAECSRRGVAKVKVLVGVENDPANRLYLKCGFELAGQIDNHGVLSNVYVAKIKTM
jgi:ribosomal protein S18 acetylase RimI-like enzyme